MSQFASAACEFSVGESQDGKHRLISVKPKSNIAPFKQGLLTFELNQEFEMGDAKTLTRMLQDWITEIRIETTA